MKQLWSAQLITTRSDHHLHIMSSRRPMGRWEWYQMRIGLALGYRMFYSVRGRGEGALCSCGNWSGEGGSNVGSNTTRSYRYYQIFINIFE